MSYIIKNLPTYQQTSDAAKAAADSEKFDALTNDLNAEINARTNDVNTLTNNLNDEINARTSDVNTLTNNLNSEVATRISEVADLLDKLNAEISTRTNNFNSLTNNLNNEISTRADETADLRTKLNTEINSRLQEDIDLNTKIDNEIDARTQDVAALNAQIIREAAERSQADINFNNALDNEIATRADNFNSLDNKIETEIVNRVSDTTLLRTQLSNAITLEEMARNNQLGDLQTTLTDIINENKLAQDAENAKLRQEIAAAAEGQSGTSISISARLDNEISQRQNDVSTLSNKINAEISNRAAALDDLNDDLKSYADAQVSSGLTTAKTYTDNQISTNFNNAKTYTDNQVSTNLTTAKNYTDNKVSTNLSTAKTYTDNQISANLTAAKNYTDEKFAAVNIDDFTAPTAQNAGKRGLVPSPPKGTDLKILTSSGWRTAADSTLAISVVPSQNGTLTFNNSNQSPTWLNFDANKLSISGTTSGKNVGTYTAYFTPIDLYVWNDTQNQAQKSASWQITKRFLTKPSASTTEFDGDGNTKTLQVNNFDSNYINRAGTYSTAEPGEYAVTFSLKDKNNTAWADGSTADVVINWKIQRRTFAKPSATITEFTYDSTTKTLNAGNFDSNYMNRTGTYSTANAGEYSVTYSLKNKNNSTWNDGTTTDVVINWKINKRTLTKPAASYTQFNYDNKTKTLTVNNYDSKYMNRTGTVSASASGDYQVTFTLKNKSNTTWSDGTTVDVVIDWKIKLNNLSVDQSEGFAQVGTLTYNGEVQEVSISNYDSAVHKLSGTTSATAAGDYIAYIEPKDNIKWADDTTDRKSVTWTIGQLILPRPYLEQARVTYDGKPHEAVIKNFDSKFMQSRQTGGYLGPLTSATLSQVFRVWTNDSRNVVFDDGSAVVYLEFYIDMAFVKIPTASPLEFNYDGKPHFPKVSAYDSNLIQMSTDNGDTAATEAGEHWIEFEVVSAQDVRFEDWEWVKYIYWQILPKPIPTPTLKVASYDYDGTEKTFQVLNWDASKMEGYIAYLTGIDENGNTDPIDFPFTGKIEIYINDTNYIFDNGEREVKLPCGIVERIVPEEYSSGFEQKTPCTYTKNYTFSAANSIEKYTAVYHKLTGTTTAKNVGEYTCYIEPKDGKTWADGTTTKIPVVWKIEKRKLPKVTVKQTSFQYTGGAISLQFENLDSDYIKTTGYTTATNVGTYEANVQLIDSNNTCWEDDSTTSLTFEWEITPDKSSNQDLYVGKIFTYNGRSQKVVETDIINFDTKYHKIAADSVMQATNAGDYKIYIELQPGYAWSDGSTERKEITWTIKKDQLLCLWVNWRSYDGTVLDVYNLPKFDKAQINVTYIDPPGSLPGEYRCILSLKDKANWTWLGGTDSEDREVIFTIYPLRVSAESSDFSTVIEYEWTGAEINLVIPQLDSEKTVLGGTVKATDVGTYTATITLATGCAWNKNYTNPEIKEQIWKITPKVVPEALENIAKSYSGGGVVEPAFKPKPYEKSGCYYSTQYSGGALEAIGVEQYLIDNLIDWNSEMEQYFELTGDVKGTHAVEYKDRERVGTTGHTERVAYLNLKTGYCWRDGTSDPIEIKWKIQRYALPDPEFNGNLDAPNCLGKVDGVWVYEWTGDYTGPTFDGEQRINRTLLAQVSPKIHEQESGHESSELGQWWQCREVGDYCINWIPEDPYNTMWRNGSATAVKRLPYRIVRKKLPVPYTAGRTVFEYNGEYQGPVIVNFDTSTMTMGNTPGYPDLSVYTMNRAVAIEPGEYSVTIYVADIIHTEFETEVDSVVIEWTIVEEGADMQMLEVQSAIKDLQVAVADLYLEFQGSGV